MAHSALLPIRWNKLLDKPRYGNLEGKWTHVAVTYDGTTRRIVINGVVEAEDTPGIPNQAPPTALRIGATMVGNFFRGQIANVRVWKVARTAQQLLQYKGRSLLDNDDGLVGYW